MLYWWTLLVYCVLLAKYLYIILFVQLGQKVAFELPKIKPDELSTGKHVW